MEQNFINDNFILSSKTAQYLYHNHVKDLPIIDYHCHLPIQEIAAKKKFENLTQIWLYGDHYKWRAMRTNGINEKYITGDASDYDKFLAWAETVPFTLRNPLYHWTHMELKKPFGITDRLLDTTTAPGIWDECNKLLQTDDFSTVGLIKQFNVETVCTTDDPVDSLEFHKYIAENNFAFNVKPAFRPDKAMNIDDKAGFANWFDKLKALTPFEISDFKKYLEALKLRHDFFHQNGCRLSDHGIDTFFVDDYTESEIEAIFQKVLLNAELSKLEASKFKSVMLYEFALMDHEKNWVQQFHFGALRNVNSRMYKTLGPDTGYDTICDYEVAKPLAMFLDRLDRDNKLAKTILYNLNPKDNELFVTGMGCFQDGTSAGKIQFGSAWWFLDQKIGMERQIDALSTLGLLSRFVGMLTDSRSFLSYPRHDYFRRILCNVIGNEVENGLIPNKEELIVPLVKNISYYNAKNYFNF